MKTSDHNDVKIQHHNTYPPILPSSKYFFWKFSHRSDLGYQFPDYARFLSPLKKTYVFRFGNFLFSITILTLHDCMRSAMSTIPPMSIAHPGRCFPLKARASGSISRLAPQRTWLSLFLHIEINAQGISSSPIFFPHQNECLHFLFFAFSDSAAICSAQEACSSGEDCFLLFN